MKGIIGQTSNGVAELRRRVLDVTKTAQRELEQGMNSVLQEVRTHKHMTQQTLDTISTDVQELFSMLRDRYAKKPDVRVLAELCSQHEDLCCARSGNVPFSEHCLAEVAIFSAEAARYISEMANLEAIERIFAAGANPKQPENFDIDLRRASLLSALQNDFLDQIRAARPGPGAPRATARDLFMLRLIESIDAALSKCEAVVTLAQTSFGRLKALPTCVACDRPLPTRSYSPKRQPHGPAHGTTAAARSGKQGGEPATDTSSSSKFKVEAARSRSPATAHPEPFSSLDFDRRRLAASAASNHATSVMRGGFRMPRVHSKSDPASSSVCIEFLNEVDITPGGGRVALQAPTPRKGSAGVTT